MWRLLERTSRVQLQADGRSWQSGLNLTLCVTLDTRPSHAVQAEQSAGGLAAALAAHMRLTELHLRRSPWLLDHLPSLEPLHGERIVR